MSDRDILDHQHRRPLKKDFEGKTVKRFQRSADNVWRIWFTDGTGFAIQAEVSGFGGFVPFMEICETCLEAPPTEAEGSGEG